MSSYIMVFPVKVVEKALPCRLRIFRYYLPVFFWCRGQLEQHRGAAASKEKPKRPLFIGMQAPQVSMLEISWSHGACASAVQHCILSSEDAQVRV